MDTKDKEQQSSEPVQLDYAGNVEQSDGVPVWFKIMTMVVIFGGIAGFFMMLYFFAKATVDC